MQLMSIEDLAAYLGDSKRTIYKYIASGDCPPYMRISSKNIKFDRADVDAWLEAKKVHPGSGGKKSRSVGKANNAKEMIKNAIGTGKLAWTPRAQAVLSHAEKVAWKDGFDLVGTEHLVFGIILVRECLGAKILMNLGLTVPEYVRYYEPLRPALPGEREGEARFSKDIDKAVQYAYEQATQWGHTYIGAEHLLVAILKIRAGQGFHILSALGITLEKVCEETAKLIACKN